MRFQLLAAQLALAALAMAGAAAAVAVGGVRLGLFAYTSGLTLMVPAVALGLIALICALTWMFRALGRNQGEGKRIGLIALFGALLFLWTPLHTLYNGFNAPPINDVTTNPENPPPFVFLAQRAPGQSTPRYDGQRQIQFRGETGTVNYILHEYYAPLTKPRSAFMSPVKAFWHNFEAAKKLGWHIVAYDEKTGRIEATASSFWFGQISDIVLRIQPAGTQGARLDLRIASASGDKDFGHNLALLKKYLSSL